MDEITSSEGGETKSMILALSHRKNNEIYLFIKNGLKLSMSHVRLAEAQTSVRNYFKQGLSPPSLSCLVWSCSVSTNHRARVPAPPSFRPAHFDPEGQSRAFPACLASQEEHGGGSFGHLFADPWLVGPALDWPARRFLRTGPPLQVSEAW